jgi:isoquinoline 1-oxidoreductase beta subunit
VKSNLLSLDGNIIVQPDQTKHNVGSAIIYGVSSVLHERVTIRDRRVQRLNFHDYTLTRIRDVPEAMHVKFVEVDTRPKGLGEMAIRSSRRRSRTPSTGLRASASRTCRSGRTRCA